MGEGGPQQEMRGREWREVRCLFSQHLHLPYAIRMGLGGQSPTLAPTSLSGPPSPLSLPVRGPFGGKDGTQQGRRNHVLPT